MATMFHNIVNALIYSDDLIFVLFSFIYLFLFIYLFIYLFLLFLVCVHQSQGLDNQQLNTSMIQRKTYKNATLNK